MRHLPLLLLVFVGSLAFGGVGDVPGVMLADEGTNAGQITRINCVGAGVSCARSGVTGTMTITGASVSAYDTVQDEGTPLTQRTTLNFTGTGVSCVDNAGSTRTDCTISGGGGGLTFGEVQRLVFLGQ